jgi:hypothetical protein
MNAPRVAPEPELDELASWTIKNMPVRVRHKVVRAAEVAGVPVAVLVEKALSAYLDGPHDGARSLVPVQQPRPPQYARRTPVPLADLVDIALRLDDDAARRAVKGLLLAAVRAEKRALAGQQQA